MYLNFVLFDDDFKLVEDNSGVRQVKESPDELQELGVEKMAIAESGFLYVYTSNESQLDVYFDNVVLGVNSGPLLEETHYYPYGLTMAGISTNALKGANYVANRRKYNGNELQSEEFSNGTGLDQYDFNARMYNQQIGLFWQVDPDIERGEQETLTPYHFSRNNPVRYNDPDGKCPNCIVGFLVSGAVDYATQVVTNFVEGESASEAFTDINWASVGISALSTFNKKELNEIILLGRSFTSIGVVSNIVC